MCTHTHTHSRQGHRNAHKVCYIALDQAGSGPGCRTLPTRCQLCAGCFILRDGVIRQRMLEQLLALDDWGEVCARTRCAEEYRSCHTQTGCAADAAGQVSGTKSHYSVEYQFELQLRTAKQV